MRGRVFLAVLLGVASMGSSRPKMEETAPYFGEHYEKVQTAARHYSQSWHEGIMITGTEPFIARMEGALELIETADSRNWYFVRKHIRRITLSGHSGMDVGGGRITAADQEESQESLGGGIIHEAWHRELFVRGRPWKGHEAERFCLEKQSVFLEKVQGAPLDVEEVLASAYWKVDYWSRTW